MVPGIKMDILTGTFWKKEGTFFCTPDEGGDPVDIVGILNEFVGLRVKFALHHWPITLQEGLPGLGSCFWGSSGDCPAGHSKNPDFLFQVGGEGVLHREGDSWFFTHDGSIETIPLGVMEGHRGRLVIVQVVTFDEFKEGFVLPDIPVDSRGNVDSEKVAVLGEQLQSLREMMVQLKTFLKED